MDRFLLNAITASVLIAVPGLFLGNDQTLGMILCFVNIAIVIFLYKNYADNEPNKARLGIGRGAVFGVIVAVVCIIATVIYFYGVITPEELKQAAIDSYENNDFMSDEMKDQAIANVENLPADTLLVTGLLFASLFNLINVVWGLIAGAIFKPSKEEMDNIIDSGQAE